MRPVALPHRRQREEIGLDRPHIGIDDLGKARIWEHRKIIGAVGADAVAQGAQELSLAPAPDPGLAIGRDVGAVESAERRRDRPPAGIRPPAMGAVGMTGDAVGGIGEISTPRDRIRLGSARRRRQCQQDRNRRPAQCLSFSRKSVWQPPQPFLPRSANAVWMSPLAPLLTATSSASALPAAVFCAARNLSHSLQISGLAA